MKLFSLRLLLFTVFPMFFISFPVSIAHAATPIPVLMYHYIRNYTYPGDPEGHVLSVSLPDFDAQMNYLSQNGYTPITLDTAAAIESSQTPSPAKPIVITFDDGTIDLYANAYPILKKYGFHATSFVITGFVGKPAYISWNNIHEMENSGLISFESHTVHHLSLSTLTSTQMSSELLTSKQTLEQETGKQVHFLAYPNGASNARVWQQVSGAGYTGAFGTWFGKMTTVTMNMPRVRVNGGESLATFASDL